MIRTEAVGIIQRGIGFRDDLSTEIIAALKYAQRTVELGRTLPWFLKEEDQTLTATLGSAEIALPTGFLREVEGESLRYEDESTSHWVFLQKFLDLNRFEDSVTDEDIVPGRPRAYYLRKSTVRIMPERDVAYDLTWSYYKADTVLDADVENAWLLHAPDILIGKAGMQICDDIGLTDAGMQARKAAFERKFSEAWVSAFAHDQERDAMNYPLFMGSRL